MEENLITEVGDNGVLHLPALPCGTKPLSHQVAGHRYGVGKTKLGFLQNEDGTILKPVQSPPRGQRELDFYKRVFNPENINPILIKLRNLMPKYLGTWTSPETPGVVYMRLVDVAHKFRKPCIADLKVGPVSYDPEATPEKIEREKLKFPPALECGYQMIGSRTYEPETGEFHSANKVYFRTLNKDTIASEGLARYFTQGGKLRKDVIRHVLCKLQEIEHWFNIQTELMFFAMSILIVFEGDIQLEEKSENNQSYNSADSNHVGCVNGYSSIDDEVEVKLIDFAHVFKTDKKDMNFLAGLYGIQMHLKMLLKM
ncbi:unnamed protein product [Owenia fusiformis]|nr:unnamed protein product [Owenia fusiformis]